MPNPNLKVFDIFYGNKCQIACQQCDTRSDLIRKGEHDPDLETIKEGILLTKEKFHIEHYSLLGGEPLLYKNKIESIVEFIRSYDTTTPIWIPTNGELISKNMDFLTNFMIKYKIMLVVSDHFIQFNDKTRSNKVKAAIEVLANKLDIQKVPCENFWSKLMYDSTDGWRDYWIEVAKHRHNAYCAIENRSPVPPDDDFWWNGDYGILSVDTDSHLKHYFMEANKPKPFNSTDIEKSYYGNCPSNYCTFMYDKKLYKCGALGTLKNFLQRHDVIDDEEWQKFLKYKPLDLVTCTDEEVENFSISKYKPISECSMCPSVTSEVTLTEENVLPIKFYKK